MLLTALLAACAAPPGDSAPPEAHVDTAAPAGAPPRLFINELMALNAGSLTLTLNATPDWVELYNPADEAVSLRGWALGLDAAGAHPLPEALSIAARGHLLFLADGGAGDASLPFRLPEAGGALHLLGPGGWRSDGLTFGAQSPDIALARAVDGDEAAGWVYVWGGTPLGPNR